MMRTILILLAVGIAGAAVACNNVEYSPASQEEQPTDSSDTGMSTQPEDTEPLSTNGNDTATDTNGLTDGDTEDTNDSDVVTDSDPIVVDTDDVDTGISLPAEYPVSDDFVPTDEVYIYTPDTDWMVLTEVPFYEGDTQCETPCETEMFLNSDYFGNTVGTDFWLDLETGEGMLITDHEASLAPMVPVFMISYNSEIPQYSFWFSGPVISVDIANYAYSDETTYSVHQNEPMKIHLVDLKTGVNYFVVASFGDEIGRVHDSWRGECEPNGKGVCNNAADCEIINNNDYRGLSAECGYCYELLRYCSATLCSDSCIGQAGNGCLHCEQDEGCDQQFLACTGLDIFPPASLTMPDWGNNDYF